ncbi:branched-chain-amino-acid aminotransferase, cytosolic-like isoform X3 [Varroa jacobsoni]|uniref:Branched-chain-amino-acid aminotransferase n=1 Tax=Varroa destructor TaxID=109461 RepID=A0A7M7JJN6_VARDE|nr:branched-chain-amino-acid aminotransferase, cytosolic-like isoform X3 [Varroa destructor]XP_022706420.1 branched-chain-amino-acid aminotransferase, cytosolic-like isoform X3 [Varroa jacobsoni]
MALNNRETKWKDQSIKSTLDLAKCRDLEVYRAARQTAPDFSRLQYGRHFADHMFECYWNDETGWLKPRISPLHNLNLHPAAKVFHYGQELFEGMKAYKGVDGKIRLFRPNLNINRLLGSAERVGLPLFDGEEFLQCLVQLLKVDSDWVPPFTSGSLYIRPTFLGIEPRLGVGRSLNAVLYIICSPVEGSFSQSAKPIQLLADPKYVRAWPGGTGDKKIGANYASTLVVQKEAERMGLQQVLWLFGPEHRITEAGTSNIFFLIRNEDGCLELITPPLNGIILPGINRQSILDLARYWNEFKVSERELTMAELQDLLRQNRLVEMFGCGTSSTIVPIERIVFKDPSGTLVDLHLPTMKQRNPLFQRIFQFFVDIQLGRQKHDWAIEVQ